MKKSTSTNSTSANSTSTNSTSKASPVNEMRKPTEKCVPLVSMITQSMPSFSIGEACSTCFTIGVKKGGSINLRDIQEKDIVDCAAGFLNSELPEINDLIASGGTRSEKRLRFDIWGELVPADYIRHESRGSYSLTVAGVCYLIVLSQMLSDKLSENPYLSPQGVAAIEEINASCGQFSDAAGAYLVRRLIA